jgi:hypothetical protein
MVPPGREPKRPSDNGAVLPIEFQPIPVPEDGGYGQLSEQAARIVEDQGGHLIIGAMMDRHG